VLPPFPKTIRPLSNVRVFRLWSRRRRRPRHKSINSPHKALRRTFRHRDRKQQRCKQDGGVPCYLHPSLLALSLSSGLCCVVMYFLLPTETRDNDRQIERTTRMRLRGSEPTTNAQHTNRSRSRLVYSPHFSEKIFRSLSLQCLGNSPRRCTRQTRLISFEMNQVTSSCDCILAVPDSICPEDPKRR